MHGETDGIEEALDGQLRLLVSTAGQIGERMARAREDAQRRAQATSEREERELRSRLDAERQASRLELRVVSSKEWWDTAKPEDIGRKYQLASAWAREDPEAARAQETMQSALMDRYGIDTRNTGVDHEVVSEAINAAERDRAQAAYDTERQREDRDTAEAASLMRQANEAEAEALRLREEVNSKPFVELDGQDDLFRATRLTRDAERMRAEAESIYDTPERRAQTTAALKEQGLEDRHVDTRMRADVSQGRPATEAVTVKGQMRGATKGKSSVGRGAKRQRLGQSR